MANIFNIIKERGVAYTFKKAVSRLRGSKLAQMELVKNLFSNKSGIEIGGPSKIFSPKGYIPLYDLIKSLDGCNFSNTTLWEGEISEGTEYNYFQDKKGTQYICEATELNHISDKHYDFLISSHCLEHVANPMKAVEEWLRVIKDEGVLLLVLPNKAYCFDHKRPNTKFSHIMDDFKNGTDEKDLTHLDEILEFHDLKMDKPAGSLSEFKVRSLKNFENRALHHHVFSLPVLSAIFDYFKLEILVKHEDENLIILGKKQ